MNETTNPFEALRKSVEEDPNAEKERKFAEIRTLLDNLEQGKRTLQEKTDLYQRLLEDHEETRLLDKLLTTANKANNLSERLGAENAALVEENAALKQIIKTLLQEKDSEKD